MLVWQPSQSCGVPCGKQTSPGEAFCGRRKAVQTRLREGGTQQRGLWRPEGLTGRGQVKGQNDPCPMDGYGAGAPLPPEASLSLALLPSEALLFHSPKLRPLPSSPFSSQGHTRPFLVWLSSESLLCEMRFPPSPLPSFKHLSGSPSRKPSLVAFPCPQPQRGLLSLEAPRTHRVSLSLLSSCCVLILLSLSL